MHYRFPGPRLLGWLAWAGLLLGALVARAQPAATPDALTDEGMALYAANHNAEALGRFQQALTLKPDDFRAQYGVALVYYATGHYAETAALCAQLVMRPDDHLPGVYVTYGTALEHQQKTAESLRVYQEAVRKFPADETLWRYQGTAFRNLGRTREAIGSFQQAVRLLPGRSANHLQLARAEADQQHRVPALLACLRGLTLLGSSRQVGTTLGFLDELLQTGKPAAGAPAGKAAAGKAAARGGPPDPENAGFAAAEALLAQPVAAPDSSARVDPAQPLARRLEAVFRTLSEQPAAARQGFTWEYYAPFFIELGQKGYTLALVHQLEQLRPRPVGGAEADWASRHPQQMQSYVQWRDAYHWPASAPPAPPAAHSGK